MKKIVGILFLCIVMCVTISFAAYPEELENAELEQLEAEQVDVIAEEPAADASSDAGVTESEVKITEDDIYKMEENVVVEGLVDGNVYVIGETVTIKDAVIYGNLYAMAGKIEVTNASIGGSVYVMADDIVFSGTTNDVYALGKNVECDLDAYIWRNLKVGAENLNVNCEIGKNLYAAVEELEVGDRTVVGGIMEYSSNKEGNISEGAQIGEVKFNQKAQKVVEETSPNVAEYALNAVSVILKTAIISVVLIIWVSKFKMIKRTGNVATDLLKSMCKGAGVFVLFPVISLSLMLTILGMALGFSVLAIYAILLYSATTVMALEIAYRILAKKNEGEIKNGKIIGLSIVVALVIWAIGLIPLIGGCVKFILILMGLGVLCDIMFQKAKKEEVIEVINEN